jgi:hypothetical protein
MKTTMSRSRKTRRQEAFSTPGHPMKTTMKMMVGTPTIESIVTMASPAMKLPEMTVATAAAAMTMVMLARFP